MTPPPPTEIPPPVASHHAGEPPPARETRPRDLPTHRRAARHAFDVLHWFRIDAAREFGAVALRPLRWLRESDPGLLRLVQALKTVLAVLVILLLFRHAVLQTRLLAGIGTAFIMQCTSTGTWRQRQVTMVVSAAAMALAVAVAAGALGGHALAQDAWLLAVAFAAFYARRFLPDQSLFPVFGFVLCLLSTAMPSGWDRTGAEVVALAVGLVVAFVIHFYLRPPDARRAFTDALSIFAARAARAAAVLEGALRAHRRPPLRRLRRLHDRLHEPLVFNQQLYVQWATTLEGDRTSRALVLQYETTHALGMLVDTVWRLTSGDAPAADPSAAPQPQGDCPEDLPPAVYTRLADLLADAKTGFARLAAGLHGDVRELQALEATADARVQCTSGDSGPLEAVILEAHHPLCPRPAQVFSALVALQELSHLRGKIALTRSDDDGTAPTTSKEPAAALATAAPQAPASTELWSDLRTPLRAAVSVGIALIVGRTLELERSYWAVLVSILLVNGTRGENTRRGLIRFGMTVAGCAAALGLHKLTDGHRAGQITVMVFGILLAAYFRTSSYPLLTFFVSLYVVFLFALIGQSPAHVLLIRSLETFIGCTVAWLAAAIVPPPRSTRQWEEQSGKVRESCRKVIAAAFCELAAKGGARGGGTDDPPDVRTLMDQLRSLRTSYDAAVYEGIFARQSRRRRRESMEQTRQLAHHALSFAEAVRVPHDPATPRLLRDELEALGRHLLSHFERVPAVPPDPVTNAARPDARSDSEMDEIQERLRARLLGNPPAVGLSPTEFAWVGSVIYHARQICRSFSTDH